MYLLEEPKRQKALNALPKTLAMVEAGKLLERLRVACSTEHIEWRTESIAQMIRWMSYGER
jgi:hypothetical protein